jgi:hypothetical protein
MNQKSKYAFIHIWPLFGCISAFLLYNRTKLVWSFAFGVHNGGERASSFVALDLGPLVSADMDMLPPPTTSQPTT